MSDSFNAIYCRERTFCTSLAPMGWGGGGGSADERTTALSAGVMVFESRGISVGVAIAIPERAVVMVALTVAVAGTVLPNTEPATEKKGSSACQICRQGDGSVDEGPTGRDQPDRYTGRYRQVSFFELGKAAAEGSYCAWYHPALVASYLLRQKSA